MIILRLTFSIEVPLNFTLEVDLKLNPILASSFRCITNKRKKFSQIISIYKQYMGEICDALLCLCSSQLWGCICNSNCCGKCFECPGQCISGVCSCIVDCCRNINCDFCSSFCSSCFSCSDKACTGVFESPVCRSAEVNCLSIFNCNSFIGSFSQNTQDCLNLCTGRLFDGFICWLYCCPTNCLTTVGYSRASYINKKESKKHQQPPNSKVNTYHNDQPHHMEQVHEINDGYPSNSNYFQPSPIPPFNPMKS